MLKQIHETLAAGRFYSMGLGDLSRGDCASGYLARDPPTKDARARVTSLLCFKPETSGAGLRMWANDHGERFPWQTPVAENGTMELADLPNASVHFAAASNELVSPKILTCPQDANRVRTNVWNPSLNLCLSHFAGLNANETKPNTILAGDRNVSTNSATMVGLLTVPDLSQLQVTPGLHQTFVHLALADGSVAQLNPAALRKTAAAQRKTLTNQIVRLVIP